ncbi:hypothetical protein HNQ92_000439 [Rhabdobacter roseus]|uniref:Uncharacterized protein n=1 Tax=Rhabdobacter roseus TaxID=1655419 RepID=A0A840TQN9_9BACT|nr:hypothetical protein [Rhabdobacter roseus]MBB5282318.1 hypothetical protein [Rhabdobacter roseus]
MAPQGTLGYESTLMAGVLEYRVVSEVPYARYLLSFPNRRCRRVPGG